MTDQISFPSLHDPAPGELAKRRQHLLSEITRDKEKTPRSLPSFTLPRARLAVLAGAVVAVAAGAVTLPLVLGGGSVAQAAPLVVQTASGKTVRVSDNAPAAATTEIVGGTATQQALMRKIVAAMQPTVIRRIEIVSSGNDVALHFTFTGHSAQAFWEESVVAGAFRDRAQAAGDDLSISLYDGMAVGAKLPPSLRAVPPAQPGDAAAAQKRFEAAAEKAGVSFNSLTIYQPDGVAVAATFESNDPASFLVHQMTSFLAALGPYQNHYDGTYVSLVDGSGHTVWESSWASRASQGSAGAIPALAGCGPVTHSWGQINPPACPAN